MRNQKKLQNQLKKKIKKDYYEARNRKMEEMVVEREILLSKESKEAEVEDDTSEISEEDSKVVEEESKAERVKAPTSPFTDSKEDEEIDDLPP